MKWIGLTGCMGCGKSTVARLLKDEHQLDVISADDTAIFLLKADKDLQAFISDKLGIDAPLEEPEAWADQDFSRYRSEISAKVFSSSKLLKEYESFFHPRIKNKVKQLKLDLSKNSLNIFYDVPLLFEKNMQSDFDYVLGVFAEEGIQYERIKERNGWTRDQVKSRLKYQISNSEKIKKCDYVIYNNQSLEKLKDEVKKFVKVLT